MNPNQNPNNDNSKEPYNPLKVMQPGERIICEIKRHPFGLLGLYTFLAFVIILAIAAVVAAPHFATNLTQQNKAEIAFGGVIVCAIVGLYTYIAATIYKGNRWVVTSDSLTQISQVGLFRKQSSQLSLANLEDVTVEQNGILQSMFGFGRLRAETAGERSKFVFDFCPKPNDYAKQIIAAHEEYIATKPEEMRVTSQPLATSAGFNQSYGPPQQAYNPTQQAAPQAQQPYQQPQQDPTQQSSTAQPQLQSPQQSQSYNPVPQAQDNTQPTSTEDQADNYPPSSNGQSPQ